MGEKGALNSFALLTLFILTLVFSFSDGIRYEPTWKSLDSRPLPGWYDEAKVGIFIHFGVYAVPGFRSEWFWCYWQCPDRIHPTVVNFMKKNYRPGFTYQDFAADFKLEFFNATEWVNLFERSGAGYAVLTSKHHEGFTMWPSKHSFSWNSMDVGPKRDVVGEFSAAVRKSSLHLGLYHSLFEWFNPLFKHDVDNLFQTNLYPTTKGTAELYELVNAYKPDLIWSDGDAGPVEYWNSTGFLAWLYNDSPVKDKVVVNDRWGVGTACRHGGFLNCKDRYNPGEKQHRKWENAMTLDKQSWGNRREAAIEDFITPQELMRTMAETVSAGGNLLVDVGPTSAGVIPPIMQERLLQMGEWLGNNGEAIYGSKPWRIIRDSRNNDTFYTSSKDDKIIYAIFLDWPESETIVLSDPKFRPGTSRVSLLGSGEGDLKYDAPGGQTAGAKVALPPMARVQKLKYAWVLKIEGAK